MDYIFDNDFFMTTYDIFIRLCVFFLLALIHVGCAPFTNQIENELTPSNKYPSLNYSFHFMSVYVCVCVLFWSIFHLSLYMHKLSVVWFSLAALNKLTTLLKLMLQFFSLKTTVNNDNNKWQGSFSIFVWQKEEKRHQSTYDKWWATMKLNKLSI